MRFLSDLVILAGRFGGVAQRKKSGDGMPTGTVKIFNADRGFGFIKPDDAGPDVFFHVSALETRQAAIQLGQRVTFEMGVDKKNGKEKAISVR